MPDTCDNDLWSHLTATCERIQQHKTDPCAAIHRRRQKEEVNISPLATLDMLRHTSEWQENLRQRMAFSPYSDTLPVYGIKAASGQTALRRLRKGRQTPNATLDLHGMTLDRAHEALRAYLPLKAAEGIRLLLIITGKGEGILKNALPEILCRDDIAPFVVCYEQASPFHGGSGAFYAVLRQKIPTIS